jgi:hypothetical protein
MIGQLNSILLKEVESLRRKFERANYRYPPYRMSVVTASHVRLARKMYGSEIARYAGPYSFLDGVPALKNSRRIVFGAHGPYVEFASEDAEFELTILEEHQWRLTSKNVKYIHKTPVGRTEKVYFQCGYVEYADYEYGMSYIDLYDLIPTG